MRLGPALLLASRSLRGRPASVSQQRAAPGEKTTPRGGRQRYLRGAVFGVALSLVPLIVVLVVADGMIQGITARYLETSTYHLQAFPLIRLSAAGLAETARGLSRSSGPITGAYAELQGPAIAVAGGRTGGALIRGIEPRLLEDEGFRAYLSVVAGELSLKGNEVILGEALARELDLAPGKFVTLVTARRGGGGEDFLPRATPFRVRGIVSAGYRELDALWAFIPLETGARILGAESSRSFIGIKCSEPFKDLGTVRELARERLEKLSPGEDMEQPWHLLTWAEAERNLWRSFSTTRALLLLIMALTVAVAAINVGSALIMLVLERRRDIAILKSTGASPADIGLVFLLAGLATGGAGTLLGLLIGSGLSLGINTLIAAIEAIANQINRFLAVLGGRPVPEALHLLNPAYYLERIPVHLRGGELALVAGLSLLLCFFASLLPARRAARLPPLEIMRKT